METEFKQVEETISRLHDLQADHLEAFDEKSLPDLEKQSEERKNEVAKLMKSVSEFVKTAAEKNGAATESMLLSLNSRITTLLEQNRAIEIKVQDFRNSVKKGMRQVSKGKQVLGSYRSSAAVSNNPRVISVTN